MFWSNEAIAAATGALALVPLSYAAHTLLTHGWASLARLGPIPDITILAVAPLAILLAVSGVNGDLNPEPNNTPIARSALMPLPNVKHFIEGL